ncbi:MAG: hypothetical protein ABI398_00395 [Devosia sp.]
MTGPVEFEFDGALTYEAADAAWMWVVRDLAPDLIDIDALDDSARSLRALESLLPDLLERASKALDEAETSGEARRRIQTQLGSDAVWRRLPIVLTALRCRGLLDKAQGFGRAANGMPDEAALVLALQAMPLNDPPVAALLMQAAVGQVAVPSRLITAAIRIAGSATESGLTRAGFAPMIDAIFAHAQNQIPPLLQSGTFSDMDLVCRSVDRFHRLMRAVIGYVEISRSGRCATIAATLTKTISMRLEPKMRDIGPDLNMALRRREGTERLDHDQVLSALNGIYLLATIRDSRDSLAVSAMYDQVWSQTGQALEIHIERLMQAVRNNPGERVASERLDAALKMVEIRFGQDYADTLRRAKESLARRA